MRRSKLEMAIPFMTRFFHDSPIKAFRKSQIAEVLSRYREFWKLPIGLNLTGFIEVLEQNKILREVKITSERYSDERRYMTGSPSIYSVALSLKRNSYITHGSAVVLHGLTDQIPKTVYLNYEQSPKPRGTGLSQASIDRAFGNQQRQSNLTYLYNDSRIVVINGKHTGRLEVAKVPGEKGELLDVTKLERTLIDIAVRPNYAGGVIEVLETFVRARSAVSVNTLIATLKKLDYVYPYHQTIGFYLERAGYPERQWQKLLKFGLKYDFYLTYDLPANKKYSPRWRLNYPQGL